MKKILIRHLVATPETIKSLVEEGVFPSALPDYVLPRVIRLFDGLSQPSLTSHTKADQTFIVKISLELDGNDPDLDIYEGSQYIHLSRIDPKKVVCIYSCSPSGRNLLISRLGKSYNHLIEVDPTKFINHTKEQISAPNVNANTKATKRAAPDQREAEEKPVFGSYGEIRKQLKSDPMSPENLTVASPVKAKKTDNLLRLSNTDEHKTFLRTAFKRAEKSILVTSYSLDSETFKILNIFSLIVEARGRGVMIYIYFSDQKPLEAELFEFLNSYGVVFDEAFTHSKLLVIDAKIVSIGSFNWLSGVSARYPNACDGTIVLQDHRHCYQLKEELWAHIKRYRNHQYDNWNQIMKFDAEDQNFAAKEFLLDNSSIIYLPTLEQQRMYLTDSLNRAKKNSIICSPFISSQGEFANDFDHNTLLMLSGQGVRVIFVCDQNSFCVNEFCQFIESLNSEFVHVVLTTDFHLKTIILDDKEISEGSFNWLSAMRDEDSQYHNHEAVVVVKGDQALPLIQHFHNSPVGKAIESYLNKIAIGVDEREALRPH